MEDNKKTINRNEETVPSEMTNITTTKTDKNTMLCKDGFWRDPNDLESYFVKEHEISDKLQMVRGLVESGMLSMDQARILLSGIIK